MTKKRTRSHAQNNRLQKRKRRGPGVTPDPEIKKQSQKNKKEIRDQYNH